MIIGIIGMIQQTSITIFLYYSGIILLYYYIIIYCITTWIATLQYYHITVLLHYCFDTLIYVYTYVYVYTHMKIFTIMIVIGIMINNQMTHDQWSPWWLTWPSVSSDPWPEKISWSPGRKNDERWWSDMGISWGYNMTSKQEYVWTSYYIKRHFPLNFQMHSYGEPQNHPTFASLKGTASGFGVPPVSERLIKWNNC